MIFFPNHCISLSISRYCKYGNYIRVTITLEYVCSHSKLIFPRNFGTLSRCSSAITAVHYSVYEGLSANFRISSQLFRLTSKIALTVQLNVNTSDARFNNKCFFIDADVQNI